MAVLPIPNGQYRIVRCEVGEDTLLDSVFFKRENGAKWVMDHKGKEREISPNDLIDEAYFQTSSLFRNMR